MMVAPTKYQIELREAIENWVDYNMETEMFELREDAPDDVKEKYKKYMDLMQKTADRILYI